MSLIARRLTLATLAALCALAGVYAFASPVALGAVTHKYQSQITEAGGSALGAPWGLTFDGEGNLLVADSEKGAVDRFSPSNAFLSPKLEGGKFFPPYRRGVAVSAASGDVYVAESGYELLDVFQPEGAGKYGLLEEHSFSGAVYVAIDNSINPLDTRKGDIFVLDGLGSAVTLHVFEPGFEGRVGTQVEEKSGFTTVVHAGVEAKAGLAVDPATGDVYVADPKHHAVKVFNDEGKELPAITATDAGSASFTPVTVTASTVGGKEAVYVVDQEANVVDQFSPAGTLLGKITGTEPASGELKSFSEPLGVVVAEHPGTANEGDLYVSDGPAKAVDVFGPSVLLTEAITEAPSERRPNSVRLNGSVNPEGLAVTSCRFEYGTTNAYGQSAPCEPDPGSGMSPVAVHAHITGLQSDTVYHYRLAATDVNGTGRGADVAFTSPGFRSESVTEVSADAAIFQATLNPGGIATSFYFQYGTTTAYGESVPAVPGLSLSPTEGDVEVPAQYAAGLLASTTYHYRVVTVQDGETFPGPDQTFTTQGSGGGTLPDGRAWEFVSPPDKLGGVIQPIGFGVVQAAADGSAITYLTNSPTEAAPAGAGGSVLQVLSTRSPASWSSKDIAPPHARATGGDSAHVEYQFFDEDLSTGLLEPFGVFEDLSPEASEQTPYLRTLAGCASSCYRPLVTAKSGYQDALPGFGEEQACEEGGVRGENAAMFCGPQFLGASSDLHHVVLLSDAPLQAGAGRDQLYEWTGGSLSPVSVLPPNGKGEELPAADGTARLGNNFTNNRVDQNIEESSAMHAVSADGSRVFWETRTSSGTTEGEKALYVRDTTLRRTLQIDTAQAACLEEVASTCESGFGRFQIASADGATVLFTDIHRLTKDSGASRARGSYDLYECRIVVEGSGNLTCGPEGPTDLTPANGGESARVQERVLGASEDGSTVYFVAEGILKAAPNARGETPTAGKPNLYVHRDGSTSFIATLAQLELYTGTQSYADFSNWAGRMQEQSARVSPNGRWLSFLSERSLTGYDNRDAVSGRPDAEIYEYDAQTARLSCASCNPTGARPHGIAYTQAGNGTEGLITGAGDSSQPWLAALQPQTAQFFFLLSDYQSRALSDSGRVFFDALDALVPQDVNGNWDVYQREPEGVGNCGPGAPGYEEPAKSCLSPISSGASDRPSVFLDASQTGGDVFFLTAANLSPQDFDSNHDVYDAHECTSASPCIPQGAQSPPPCSTEASCKTSPTPQPQIYGAPASSTFQGPGNLPPAATPVKAKTTTRHQLLLKALAACHRRYPRSKTRRSACEHGARRKYAAKAASKHTVNNRRAS